jgi:tetratricopeptide (TPR) repeat protein
MPTKIFINYRRQDSIDIAGRLHDRLTQAFEQKNLFMDVDNIPAGVDFVAYLNSQVTACDVILVVIGRNWLDAKDESGRRRLNNPDDFVTIEIAAALARNICVIPVLVDGARMPKASELPASLKPLARRQAIEVGQLQFGRDAEALVERVREALDGGKGSLRPWRGTTVASVAALALFLVGWVGFNRAGIFASAPSTIQLDTRDADNDKAAAEAEAKRGMAEQAEQQRLATLKAEQERQARVATEAEAKRIAEQAEQQRLAALKAEQERNRAETVRYASLVFQGVRDANSGDYDKAIATFSEAMRFDSKNALAFGNRGLAYLKKGDYNRAIADYNEAIRLNPKYALAFCSRGRTKLKIKDTSGNADIAKARQLDASICR